jgi:outer membrane protein TolC
MSFFSWRTLISALPIFYMLAGSGCRSYAPAPIDWPHEASGWSASATLRAPLTLAEARQCALFLNPEINALRLSRQNSKRHALAAGWWEDPAFNLDVLRMLRGGPHPWILGSGLSFSLPLNGVPGIEKRAAQAYAHADALAVTVAERELVAEVDRLWNACLIDRRHADEQSAYMERLAARERHVRALVEAGELPKVEGDRIAQARNARLLDCACCGAEAVARRQALLRVLGLHPSAPVEWAPDRGELAALGVPPDSELDLIRHPRVQEKLARLKAGEEELRAEIRKQYPDLELGPLYENEDGGGRLGMSLGFKLPLWNRNRKGIADAEGGRDAARLAAVNAWRGLVTEWHEARGLLQAAETKERRLRETQLPDAKATAKRIERLFNQGEADVLAILAADETVYTVQEALLEARRTLHEARVRVNLLNVPEQTNGKDF